MGRGRPRRKGKDKYGVDYKIFGTCSRHARAAGSDTVEQAASRIVQWFGCPMLYAEPPKPRWWTKKLRECRRNFGSFMLLIAAAALAIPCVFHRRVVHEARTVGDYAITLKNTNHPDRKQLGVQLAHALLHKVNPAMIEIAQNRWRPVLDASQGLKDIIKATLGANGCYDFDYDDPDKTGMIQKGALAWFHVAGFYLGSGMDYLRDVVAHANGVDKEKADGFAHHVSVDNAHDVEGEQGTTMNCEVEAIAQSGKAQDTFINVSAARCNDVGDESKTPLGSGVLVALSTVACTDAYNLQKALVNHFPSQTLMIVGALRQEGYGGYEGMRKAADLKALTAREKKLFYEKLGHDYETSEAKQNMASFYFASRSVAEDNERVRSLFATGRGWRRRPVPVFHELSESMKAYYGRLGELPKDCVEYKVGSRFFYAHKTNLPGLDLLIAPVSNYWAWCRHVSATFGWWLLGVCDAQACLCGAPEGLCGLEERREEVVERGREWQSGADHRGHDLPDVAAHGTRRRPLHQGRCRVF